jgi:FkbM family methyltransferase
VARFQLQHLPWQAPKRLIWERTRWRVFDYQARTVDGVLMAGTTADLLQRNIYYFGIWEPNLTHFIKERLTGLSGRVFADIGANIGYFSLLAARCMPRGSVIAFEPFPSIYSRLLHNIELNGVTNIKTLNLAASDSTRQLDMFHGGSANEGATTSVPGRFHSPPISVRARPLSEMLSAHEVASVKLIKIDVEGAEATVIRGLGSLLPSLPFDAELVVEISTPSQGEIRDMFDILSRYGFNAYSLENSYEDQFYLSRHRISRPERLWQVPSPQLDVVFSRIDSSCL